MDIVVGAALSGIMDALPGKLGGLLEQEYELLSGARGDVEFLQMELSSMRAAIRHCESLDNPDAQTGTWIGRVRELAYDIEDWVDLFGIRVDGRAPTSSGFFGWLRRGAKKLATMPDRHVIANELRDLKERVVELSEQRNRYRCDLAVSASPSTVDPRLVALFADPGSLVGLAEPVEEVTRMVTTNTGGRTGIKIVFIIGMAGAGKTTLANAVYKQLEAQKSFECYAFVSVGRKPENICKVLTDMLWKLGGGKHRGIDDINQLIRQLREVLEKKRYLIVVDDLWSSNHWKTIMLCCPENSLESRIITTTRNAALARKCSSGLSECIYNISFLSQADSETLFLKKAFGSGNSCPQYLKDVFDQTVSMCGGLPLAIVSRAGLLAHKQSRDDWERLGLGSLSSSHPDGVKQILNLSYNDLEANLKTCLLYLSLYSDDTKIETERLVRRWIAEGFIPVLRGATTEGTARSYLNDLVKRNLVQPLYMNHENVPRYCTVHPVIHDFIVCKSKDENFATLVDAQQLYVPNNNNSTIRRLSLKNSGKQAHPAVQNEHMDLSHARSITVFSNSDPMPLLTDLKVVRVLDLECCNGPVCLDSLCKLLLLRYLSLRGTDINELPATIGELKWLETLDVRSTKVKELPPSIAKLKKLTHLLTRSTKLPGKIAEMKALQTLSCSVDAMEQLRELTKVTELELFCDEAETPGNETGVTFTGDGFQGVKRLCIRSSSPSMTFESGALPDVQVLELRFKEGLADKSSGVSGIQYLLSLKHIYVEFLQHDAGAMATVDAIRQVVNAPNHQEVTIMVNEELQKTV
ncbi:hypothetical protein QOZ80_1AG0015640 [Eleusine coracana subsp. coracana]|nr:hypothetical protein QOZ80_1AG0015640 [Eleusine coracana subsp. coracana]